MAKDQGPVSKRGYRDVSSPEAKARIWKEAREQSARDSDTIHERLRSRRLPFGFTNKKE
ncbi:hypothetical protein GS448_15810 [Rhodococcus hoagii]|nr:hypothetical protein [Prescottella equi]MBM4668515.1 hypothetical protein [Prescottella equi]NKV88755.1 hypothetical protein [Prescottella equi]